MPRRLSRRIDDLPALRDFARAYLHEDVLPEHGGGPEAAAAFVRDASDEERRRLLAAFERLERLVETWPAERLARFFTDTLGAAWTPASADEVRSMIAAIRAERR
jgi:CdiI immunity protein